MAVAVGIKWYCPKCGGVVCCNECTNKCGYVGMGTPYSKEESNGYQKTFSV